MDASGPNPSELDDAVERLAARDWPTVRDATQVLVAAGDGGMMAAVRGLDHPNARVRRRSADFLDHHADDLCVEDLRRVATSDPVPSVRRAAVHALGCVSCKPVPLEQDFCDFIAGVITNETENPWVRDSAIWVLKQQRDSSRIAPPLRSILERETHPRLRRSAHRLLRLHDPEYRRLTDVAARAAQASKRNQG